MAKLPRKPKAKQWGDGSISQLANGKWRAKISVEGREYRKQTSTREAAEAWLVGMREQRDAGLNIAEARQSVASWLTAYHAERIASKRLRPRTIERELDLFEQYVIPHLGGITLVDLTPTRLQRWIYAVRDDIAARNAGVHSGERTAQQAAVAFKAALRVATQRRMIDRNPFDGVALPSVRPKRITPATVEQLQALWACIHTKQHPALWACYILLGLRRGEGIGIRVSDVDLVQHQLRIEQQIVTVANRPQVGPIKTAAGVRTLPIPAPLATLLRAQLVKTAEMRLRAGRSWADGDLLFCTDTGGPVAPSNVDRAWRGLRDYAGLPSTMTLHHLRHSAATLYDECGASEALQRSILGHGARTVTQHYTKTRIETMRRVIDAAAQAVVSEPKSEESEAFGT